MGKEGGEGKGEILGGKNKCLNSSSPQDNDDKQLSRLVEFKINFGYFPSVDLWANM